MASDGASERSASQPEPSFTPVFVVGTPRSGTTLLQVLLSAHPDVCTVRETHLFDHYVGALNAVWKRERANAATPNGLKGFMDEDAFRDSIAVWARHVLTLAWRAAGARPVFIEKTPPHINYHRWIATAFPNARFLQIVRDPRSVAASLLAARKERWGAWAPADAHGAAQWWRRHVRMGERMDVYGTRYTRLRYEDIRSDPQVVAAYLTQSLGLPDADLGRAGPHGPEALDPRVETRRNFDRGGEPDKWRNELAPEDVRVVEAVCLEEMLRLGYQPVGPAAVD